MDTFDERSYDFRDRSMPMQRLITCSQTCLKIFFCQRIRHCLVLVLVFITFNSPTKSQCLIALPVKRKCVVLSCSHTRYHV